jgi:protocatechuate 3,4-dioxygenase beta subunit
MKRLLTLLIFSALLLSSFSIASDDCLELNFRDWNVCIYIEKNRNNYRVIPELSNTNSTVALKCDILLPDNTLQYIWACDTSFEYNWTSEKKVKLYVRLNNEYKQKEAYYDFGKGERWDDDYNDDYNYDYNREINNFNLSTNNSTPSINQRVNLSIRALDQNNNTVEDYNSTVKFKVYYCNSSSCSLSSTTNRIQTTSSTYYEINSTYLNWYSFSYSNYWNRTLTDFIRFKRENYSYKIRVYDQNNTNIYKDIKFTVGYNNDYNNSQIDNLLLTTNNSNPSTDQRIDLRIRARDNYNNILDSYRWTVNFKVYYRNSSSDYWRETTSSAYYSINSSYRNWYSFTYSNQWDVTLSNFIKFYGNYNYKIRVYDQNDANIYKEIFFTIGSNNNNYNRDINNFNLSTNNSTPSINQRVNLSIRALDQNNNTVEDYNSTVKFKVYYCNSSSCSLSSTTNRIQTTSSTYYEINSTYLNWYSFSYSNYWNRTLTDFIRFKRENYSYKIRVYDQNNTNIYKDIKFTVGYNNDYYNGNFSLDEINKIEKVYNIRESLINKLKREYYKLRNNNTRQERSNNLYKEMGKIINGQESIYTDREEFYDAFLSRYSYTLRIR